MSIFKGLLDLFFPSCCLHCNSKMTIQQKIPLCVSCEAKLESASKHGVKNQFLLNRFKGLIDFELCSAMYYFSKDGVSQSLIHEAKYKKQIYILEYYGKILADRVKLNEEFSENLPDLVIPIPNHWLKRMKLGFNQSEVLANAFSKELSKTMYTNVLVKSYDSSTQTKLKKLDRLLHLKSLYSIKNQSSVKGKHVLIMDDVITSGATIETCANLLLDAGASKVSVGAFMLVR